MAYYDGTQWVGNIATTDVNIEDFKSKFDNIIKTLQPKFKDFFTLQINKASKEIQKQDVEVEQDRDVETKTNTVVLSTYYVCALVDDFSQVKVEIEAQSSFFVAQLHIGLI